MANFTSISGAYIKTIMDDRYYYALCSSGIVMVNKETKQEDGHAHLSNATDLWCKPTGLGFIYITTSGGGLKALPKSEKYIGDLTSLVAIPYSTPHIHSNNLLCIDGNSSNNIAIGSVSGVEIISGTHTYKSTTYSGITDVVLTEDTSIYYTGNSFGIACKKSPITVDWSTPTLLINKDKNPRLPTNAVKELYVSESLQGIVLSIATTSGVIIIKENQYYLGGSPVLKLHAQ